MEARLEKVLTWIVQIFALGILLLLVWMSATRTAVIYTGREHTEYTSDLPLLHLFVFLLVIIAVTAFRIVRPTRRDPGSPADSGTAGRSRKRVFANPDAWEIFLAVFLLAAGIAWLCFLNGGITSDSYCCFEAAREFLEGKYSAWEAVPFSYGKDVTGYAYTYPSQNGLILYFALLVRLFGFDAAPAAARILNLVYLYAGTWFLVHFLGGKRAMHTLALLFLPFSFYYTFAYGTMPGFAASMAALWCGKQFVRRGNPGWALLSAVLIALSCELKANYLITAVALVFYFGGEALIQRKMRFFAGAFAAVLMIFAAGQLVTGTMTRITGHEKGGIPMTAWVEMGLQDGSRAPGWYNQYNVRVFQENGGDPAATAANVRKDLRKTVAEMAKNPQNTLLFFEEKVASQWTEPTFESLWIQEVTGGFRDNPEATDALFSEGGSANVWYVGIFDLVQTLIYAGTILFLLLDSFGKRGTGNAGAWYESRIPLMIFVGGFVFHLFWEAKTQYTICCMVLLVPYACLGCSLAADRVLRLFRLDRE